MTFVRKPGGRGAFRPRLNGAMAATREGVAAWWPSGSLASMDFENSRFRAPDGTTFATEAAFNTYMGITKSGEARTWPHQVFGAEMAADPNFLSGVDGWSRRPASAAGLDDPMTLVSGAARVTWTNQTDGADSQRIGKQFASVTGQAYAYSVTYKGKTGTVNSAGARIANNTDLGSAAAAIPSTPDWSSAPGTFPLSQTCIFGAPGTTGYLGVVFGTVGATASFDIESYSLMTCRPYAGFQNQKLSALLDFTTPASLAAVKVLLQWGGTQESNRVRLQISAAGALSLMVARDGVEQGPLALGTLSPSTRYTLKMAVENNRLSASLNGAPIVSDTSATLPGLGLFWLGRSYTGEAFDGVIHNCHLWAEALSDAALVSPLKAMVIWGDSLATATGASVAANAWWNLLAADLGWTVVSKGVGGNDTATELGRFNSETETAYRGWLNIFIDRPNTGEAAADWLANVYAMGSQVDRWFVVPPVLNSASGLPDTSATAITAVKAALLSGAWAGHTLDAAAQSALQTSLDADSTRVGGGDWTHFDDDGHLAVKATTEAGLQALSYAP